MPEIFLENVSAGYGVFRTPLQRFGELIAKGGRSVPGELCLRRVSMTLSAGESLAVMGEEQGRRALTDVIAGRLRPVGGRGRVKGRASVVEQPEHMLHMGSTILENALLYGRLRGYSRAQVERRLEGVLWMAEADELLDQQAAKVGAAALARLCFALGLNFEPDILLIDLPLEGLGVDFEKRCRARIKTLLGGGAIVVDTVCTRMEARSFFQKALLIEQGRVVSFGPARRALPMDLGDRGERIRLARAEIGRELAAGFADPRQRARQEQTVAALLALVYRLTGDLQRQKEREALGEEEPARASRDRTEGAHRGGDEPREGD